MALTALYAALLAPLYVLLSVRVIAARRSGRIPVGDGGNAGLLRRMRVQANFAENVPLTLILLALAESLGTDARLLHLLGIALVAGRLSHAFGMSQDREIFAYRVAGIGITFTVMMIAAAACLYGALSRALG